MADFTFFQQLKDKKEFEKEAEQLDQLLNRSEHLVRSLKTSTIGLAKSLANKDVTPQYTENYNVIARKLEFTSQKIGALHDAILHKTATKEASEEIEGPSDSTAKVT